MSSRGKSFFQSTPLNVLPHFLILFLQSVSLCPKWRKEMYIGVRGDASPLVTELPLVAWIFPNLFLFL